MPTNDRRKDPSKALSDRIETAVADLHTAIPGRIKSYDATKQTATVQIALRRLFRPIDQPAQEIEVSPIIDVPVLFPRAGGYSITFPVAVDDPCLVVFAERDIGGWLENGATAIPPTARKHDYSDAVAILGLWPTPDSLSPAASTSALQLRRDDAATSISLTASIEIDAINDASINAADDVSVSAGDALFVNAGGNVSITAGALMALVATGAITVTPTGAFTVAATGPVTITRGANELLTLISEALDEIGTSTVGGSPLSNAANIAAIKALVDAMRA